MSLPQDLLELAHSLLVLEPRRPKQATLRRAISTAYYALFHLLVSDSAKFVVSGSRNELRAMVARAYDHSTMRKVCRDFAKPSAFALQRATGRSAVPAQLRAVARSFFSLQEQRHAADYDPSMSVKRAEIAKLLNELSRTFADWESIRATPEGEVFMAALLLADRWERR